MAKILYLGTAGSDDPTRAGLPFVLAKGAQEAGHEPIIVLVGEATHLLRAEVAASTQGVGWPSVADQWKAVTDGKATVYV
jgi:predicted peroxiredoxin